MQTYKERSEKSAWTSQSGEKKPAGLPFGSTSKNTMNPLSQKRNVTQDVSCFGIIRSLDFTDFKNIHTFLNEQMKD